MNEKTANHVLSYRDRTKHHYERYARSPGYMDWRNPDFLCVVSPSNDGPRSLNPEIVAAFAGLTSSGVPNRLSESPQVRRLSGRFNP